MGAVGRWGKSSGAECWPSMCEALGLIPSTTKIKVSKEEEFGAIFLQIKAHLGPL